MLPKVGQTVLVTLKSKTNKSGRASLSTHKRVVQKITRVYDGGHVSTTSGDIWNVKVLNTGKADFIVDEAASS